MARPTDPEKLAALRARQAANSRAYRARKRAEREVAAPKPRAPRQAPSSESAVLRAHEQRAEARRRRNEAVGQLPSARNPRVKVYTPRELETAPAAIPDTAPKRRQRIKVLRENTAAGRLTAVGKRRQTDLRAVMDTDPRRDAIRENLTPDQLRRFTAATQKMASVSQQTLAVFMTYEGGDGDYQSALTQIAYPKGTDTEDQVGRVESLAELLERAEALYGPAALRGSEVGGKSGRLRL